MLRTSACPAALPRIEVAAELDADVLAEVTFAVRGDHTTCTVGIDDGASGPATTGVTCLSEHDV